MDKQTERTSRILGRLACMAALSCLATLAAGCSPTHSNWQTARNYQAEGRHELARQYFVVALASAKTPEEQTALKQEIEAADRMIQAFR